MFTPITIPSSLDFWKQYSNRRKLVEGELYDQPFDKEYRSCLLDFAKNYRIETPLHIMVPDKSLRSRGSLFKTHVMPRDLPNGSFVQMDDIIQITSPELTFLLGANDLSVAELTVLACDLCGIYYFDPYAEIGQSSREQITTVEEISSYLDKVKKFNGLHKARTAIQFALDRSNSPMESKLAAIEVIRYLYGGFSIEKPELNYLVKLSPEGKNILRRDYCCCDMVWPEKRIVVEYDSDLAHLSPNQVHYDKRRVTALQLSGYKVIIITKDYFRNENTVEELFLIIHKTLGSAVNKRAFDKNRDSRREAIRKLFLTF